jgi:hypothetical protein
MDVLLLLPEGAGAEALPLIVDALGARAVVRAEDFDDAAIRVEQTPTEAYVFLSHLGVVLVRLAPDQGPGLVALRAAAPAVSAAVVSEALVLPDAALAPAPEETPAADPRQRRYLQGYRDATLHLTRVAGIPTVSAVAEAQSGEASTEYQDDANGTWGLHATGVLAFRQYSRNFGG